VPGLFVSEIEAVALISRITGPRGLVDETLLLRYLRSEGISASISEVREMIRMLGEKNVPSLPSHHSTTSANHRDSFLLASAPPRWEEEDEEEGRSNPSQGPRRNLTIVHDARSLSDDLWALFLNRSFIVGEAACREKFLEAGAIEQREAFIFLAIPCVTFLDIIMTSQLGEVNFGPGRSLTLDQSPPDWKPIIQSLVEAGSGIKTFQSQDVTFISKLKLALSADPVEGISFEDTSDAPLTRIRGLLQGAATTLTQTERFRETYEHVFGLIDSVMKSPRS
jgi:hypothetical protein